MHDFLIDMAMVMIGAAGVLLSRWIAKSINRPRPEIPENQKPLGLYDFREEVQLIIGAMREESRKQQECLRAELQKIPVALTDGGKYSAFASTTNDLLRGAAGLLKELVEISEKAREEGSHLFVELHELRASAQSAFSRPVIVQDAEQRHESLTAAIRNEFRGLVTSTDNLSDTINKRLTEWHEAAILSQAAPKIAVLGESVTKQGEEVLARLDKIGEMLAGHLAMQRNLARAIEGNPNDENQDIIDSAKQIMERHPEIKLETAVKMARENLTYRGV